MFKTSKKHMIKVANMWKTITDPTVVLSKQTRLGQDSFLCRLTVFRGSDTHLRDVAMAPRPFFFHVSSAGTCRRGVCGNSRDSGEAVRGMTTMHHSNTACGLRKFQKPICRSLQLALWLLHATPVPMEKMDLQVRNGHLG